MHVDRYVDTSRLQEPCKIEGEKKLKKDMKNSKERKRKASCTYTGLNLNRSNVPSFFLSLFFLFIVTFIEIPYERLHLYTYTLHIDYTTIHRYTHAYIPAKRYLSLFIRIEISLRIRTSIERMVSEI